MLVEHGLMCVYVTEKRILRKSTDFLDFHF